MNRVICSLWRLLMRSAQSLVFLLALSAAANLAGPITTNATETSYPQFVRVSYAQGEVKLSMGIKGNPDLGKDWVAAGVNFPIEDGATLATEQGRAEVEFENGSVAYLAEHSVLQFKRLTRSTRGTSTKVTLLTGRATFAIESNGHDDFTLKTGVTSMHLNQARTLRVDSALDGAMFHVVEGSFAFNEAAPK